MYTGASLIFEIATIICGFIIPKLILTSYGSEVNGLINSVTQLLGIISFLELGVGTVIQSSLYKPLVERDSNQISRVLVSGQRFFGRLAQILLLYVIILMVTYPFFANQEFNFLYTATMIGVVSISMFAQYFFGIINSVLLTADQKGYFTYNIQTITLVMNTVACYILIRLGAPIHIVKLTTSLIYILRPLALAIYVKFHYSINWKIQYQGEPIRQKWNGVAQHIAAVVLDGTDNIVLTVFAGLKAVSVYSVYQMVTAGVKKLLVSSTNGVQSIMGELWAKQELEKLREFFGWVEWTIHTGTTLVFGITASLIVPFVKVYTYGVADTDYIQPLFALLLVFANAGHCLRLPYNLMILAGGHYKETQNNYIIAAVLNIVISVLAVKSFGLVGVAVGTVIAMMYQTVWMAVYDSKNLVYWPLKNFIKQLAVDISTAVLIYTVSLFFSMKSVSFFAWVIFAVKVSVMACIGCILINILFYRVYVVRILKGVINMVKYKGGYTEVTPYILNKMEGRCLYAC